MKLVSELIAGLVFLSTIFVPSDRVRISMIKSGEGMPEAKLGWVLILLFSFIPFMLGVYTSSISDLAPEQHRANAVVGAIFFWGCFTFGLNCLLFKNRSYWKQSSKRITNHST
ncbi:hypothetical protein OAP14_07025 [Aliiglaciecola sp.]|nr:hypothetical protein [Aliiglaciecola sp.]